MAWAVEEITSFGGVKVEEDAWYDWLRPIVLAFLVRLVKIIL